MCKAKGETELNTTEQKDIAQELVALLEPHRDEIAASWAKEIRQLPDSHYRELPVEDLVASTSRVLGAMLEALGTGDYTALEAYLADVCLTRLLMGFGAAEVNQALMLCKDVALPFIRRAYPPDSTVAWASNSQLDACQRRMIGHFSQLYVTEAGRLLEEQQARTALMLDMAQTAGSTLDLDEVLRRAAEGIATAAGVRHCGFYLYDEEQGLLLPQLGTNRLRAPTHLVQQHRGFHTSTAPSISLFDSKKVLSPTVKNPCPSACRGSRYGNTSAPEQKIVALRL